MVMVVILLQTFHLKVIRIKRFIEYFNFTRSSYSNICEITKSQYGIQVYHLKIVIEYRLSAD